MNARKQSNTKKGKDALESDDDFVESSPPLSTFRKNKDIFRKALINNGVTFSMRHKKG